MLKKNNHLYRKTLRKIFNSFGKSVLNAQRQGDGNPNSNIFAEKVELLLKSTHCYETIRSSQHILTKILSHEKTDSVAKNSIKLMRVRPETDHPYEVELARFTLTKLRL